MNTLEHLIQDDYNIIMSDIIREGHPTLREVATAIVEPISEEYITLGKQMLQFLENSQDPDIAQELDLRGGVGIAAPQLDIPKRIMAVLIPSEDEESDEPKLREVMFNPKVLSHSVQQTCLKDGEGCLSVDREVPGYVVRADRITITYTNMNNEKIKMKLRGYEAIVVQHEIDHLNGVMFFDHINEENPFAINPDIKVID
ncbi:MAG: peptide deformylase [Streptococcaceae bacterium]|nr:peptide deformylase [Streptococcaceae bacterium]